MWSSGSGGAFLTFFYKGNTVVSGYTGCRLS
ncbi:LppA family lipoprotein [Mycolicibacterium sarraceniae]|nr:LppA family lipoprotein [Mycolicibacterium sarraceniae]